jgi:uncharacterized protein (TIGR02300 family)
MTKLELGTKRLCAHCRAKFYDLNRAPIACPKCGTAFEAVQVSSRSRAETARAPVREVEPVVAETQEDQFAPLEDAEAQGDEVEPDHESLDDAPLIEENEEEDTDVTEIIGDTIEDEEGA